MTRILGFVVWLMVLVAIMLALTLPSYSRVVLTDSGPAWLWEPHQVAIVQRLIVMQAEEIEALRVELQQRCLK